MTRDEDFRCLLSVPADGFAEWIERRFPAGAPTPWWIAMFESVETGVGRVQKISQSARRKRFEVGARAIMLAVDRAEVRPAMGAYWLIRLAAIATDIVPPVGDLPAILSPDGVARWALVHIPISREAAIEYAARRNVELAKSDEDYCQSINLLEQPLKPSSYISLLQETEQVITAFRWIIGLVSDDELRTELYAWLDTDRHL